MTDILPKDSHGALIEGIWKHTRLTLLKDLLRMAIHKATRPSDGLTIGGIKDVSDPAHGDHLGGPVDSAGSCLLLIRFMSESVSPLMLKLNATEFARGKEHHSGFSGSVSRYVYEKLSEWLHYAGKMIIKSIDGWMCKTGIEEDMWSQVKRLDVGFLSLKPFILLYADLTYRYTSSNTKVLPLVEKIQEQMNQCINFRENCQIYMESLCERAVLYRERYGPDAELSHLGCNIDEKRRPTNWIGTLCKPAETDFTQGMKADWEKFVQLPATQAERDALAKELDNYYAEHCKIYYAHFVENHKNFLPTNPFEYFGWAKKHQFFEKEFNSKLLLTTSVKTSVNANVTKELMEQAEMAKKAEELLDDPKVGLCPLLEKFYADKNNQDLKNSLKSLYEFAKPTERLLVRMAKAFAIFCRSNFANWMHEKFSSKDKPFRIQNRETKSFSRESLLTEGFVFAYEQAKKMNSEVFGGSTKCADHLKLLLKDMLDHEVPPELEPNVWGAEGISNGLSPLPPEITHLYQFIEMKGKPCRHRWIDEFAACFDSLLMPPFAPTNLEEAKSLVSGFSTLSDFSYWAYGSSTQATFPKSMQTFPLSNFGSCLISRMNIMLLLRIERAKEIQAHPENAKPSSSNPLGLCGFVKQDKLVADNSTMCRPSFYPDSSQIKTKVFKNLLDSKWIVEHEKDKLSFAIQADIKHQVVL